MKNLHKSTWTFFGTLRGSFAKLSGVHFIFTVSYRRHIEVHGRPTPAVFRKKPHQAGKNSYRLVWTVDSYTAIQEYRLLYRQIKPFHPVSTTLGQTGPKSMEIANNHARKFFEIKALLTGKLGDSGRTLKEF